MSTIVYIVKPAGVRSSERVLWHVQLGSAAGCRGTSQHDYIGFALRVDTSYIFAIIILLFAFVNVSYTLQRYPYTLTFMP